MSAAAGGADAAIVTARPGWLRAHRSVEMAGIAATIAVAVNGCEMAVELVGTSLMLESAPDPRRYGV